MADITYAAPSAGFLTRGLVAFWNGLISITESCSRARMVQQLNDISDEELAARGTTRVAEVKRMFNVSYHI